MTLGGKLFWVAITTGGLCSALWSFWYWSIADFRLFLIYAVLAGASACWRIKVPGVSPALSIHFVFVLLSVSQLSLSETMVIALGSALLQFLLHSEDKDPTEFLFDLGAAALAATGTYLFHAKLVALGAAGPSPLAMAASATILFLLTTLPACVATRLKRGTGSVLETWQTNCLKAFPHYLAGGGAAGMLSLVSTGKGWEVALLILPAVYWLYASHRQHVTSVDEDRRQIRELASLNYRTIEALSLTMETRDPRESGHSRRVSIYVSEIGRYLGLPEREQQALHVASVLHNIGKLAVPEHILSKPEELSDAELESLKIHPIAGAEILEEVRFPYPVAPIVRAHREKWDGTGYPEGLKGEEIPIGARILAVVDCLDALISSGHHHKAFSVEQAIDIIRGQSGKSFDPAVVQVLLLHYRELELKVAEARPHGVPTAGVPAKTGQPSSFFHRVAAARKEERNLFLLLRELGNSLTLDETLEVCAQRIRAMCPSDAVLISIRRENGLAVEYSSGVDFPNLARRRSDAGDLSLEVAATVEAIVNGDPEAELGPLGAAANDLRSALVAPLQGLDGVVGVVTLLSREQNAYTPDHLRVLTSVSTKAALSVENAIKFSRAESSASTDMLTGLPNARSLFMRLDAEIARSRRERTSLAVLVCDLDKFKEVNDQLGHVEGNRVLRRVAEALASQCREYDFLARMGGDEFVAILNGYPKSQVEAKIQQLQLAVDVAFRQTPFAVNIGLSVGHAMFPDDGEDAESLLAAADRNMYRMKLLRKHPLPETESADSYGLHAAMR